MSNAIFQVNQIGFTKTVVLCEGICALTKAFWLSSMVRLGSMG
jgi:hypothetical protein